MMTQVFKTNNAFSLIELVVVLAVIALLLAFAAPRFQQMRETWKLKSAARDLFSEISYMKIKALETGKCYTISGVSNNSYQLFLDNDCDSSLDISDGDSIVHVNGLPNGVLGTNLISMSISFDRNGFPFRNGSALSAAFTLQLQSLGSQNINIIISPLGRVRIQ